MAFRYDIDKIFAELEQQAKKEIQNRKKNDSIESPEDAPKTQDVAPATSKTTEDKHGGDEASKEIKDSPNSIDGGENINKENNRNSKTTSEDLQHVVEKIFEEKKKRQEDFRRTNKEEYLKKYILEIIKKIAAGHAGMDKEDGSETYDKKQMLKHMLKYQNYKLLGDKYDLRDARYVQFFIDTSGVYGCGSNKILHELIPKVIDILERQGYECHIAACANGFYERDLVEDEYYETRKTLEGYKVGKVNRIACPTVQTAAKMANEAEFSIILADFDGLSSICKMASLCQKDKVPYFLCTEDRYPWEDPTLHNWVDPDESYYYNPEFVYDVSVMGNPTLEQFESRIYEYEQDDDMYYDN